MMMKKMTTKDPREYERKRAEKKETLVITHDDFKII